jgi:hypothetical protein
VRDDMTTLRDLWVDIEPPAPEIQAQARAALMARVAGSRASRTVVAARPRRALARGWHMPVWAWRSVIASGAVAALAATVVAVGGYGRSPDPTLGTQPTAPPSTVGPPIRSVAHIIELAATNAAGQPFTPPRPDQWIYIELRQSLSPKIAGSKGTAADKSIQFWKRADGRQEATVQNGSLVVVDHMPGSETPPSDYPTLASLPTDPDAMLAWVYSRTGSDAYLAFSVLASMACLNLLPPDVAAAALRAAALIPGVTESPVPANVDGRALTAVGRVMDGWRQMDILIEPETNAVVGIRNIAVADYRDPNGHFEFAKGDLMDMTILKVAAIVDAPGQTG